MGIIFLISFTRKMNVAKLLSDFSAEVEEVL